MLLSAQRALAGMQDETLQWIKDDLAHLEAAFNALQNDADFTKLEDMKASALSIKSRAGTFGFAIPSQIARMLYLFL
jgi:hypothetical protein